MATQACNDSGHQVSLSAAKCPACGSTTPHSDPLKSLAVYGVLAGIVVIIIIVANVI